MKTYPILMYSGGRESTLLLDRLVKDGHNPVIFHIYHGRMTPYYERIVKRNAMRINKTYAYYVFQTRGYTYDAYMSESEHYGVTLNNKEKLLPYRNGSPVVIGYWKKDNASHKMCIENIGELRPNQYSFPLADYDYDEIHEMWKELPKEVRKNTVSSCWWYEGQHKDMKVLPFDNEEREKWIAEKYGA